MSKNVDLGGELTDLPNNNYKKFFEKFKEIDTIEPSDWKLAHILSYFCKKYKEQYNTDYKFKFNSPAPSKCFEVFQIKKLSSMLTSNPSLLKEYIDWVYENKVIKAKRKLTSISFITNEQTVNEYKINVLFANSLETTTSRSTPLPEKYKSIFENAGFPVNTYGDLSFLFQMTEMPEHLKDAFKNIEDIGFNKDLLNKIV